MISMALTVYYVPLNHIVYVKDININGQNFIDQNNTEHIFHSQ